MRRIVLAEAPAVGARVHRLDEGAAHYAGRVLRLGPGTEVEALDGAGGLWRGRLGDDDGHPALLALVLVERAAEEARLVVACGLVKSPRWETVVEVCSELGATDLIPLLTARTVVRVEGDRADAKTERWQRIANESAKQCERLRPLRVHRPATFSEVVGRGEEVTRLLVDERAREGAWSAGTMSESVLLLLGPEGGFTDDERALAHTAGLRSVGLGRHVLRSATAVASALSHVRGVRDDLWER